MANKTIKTTDKYPIKFIPNGISVSKDTLWLRITAKEFKPSVIARGGYNKGAPIETFSFLMPPTLAYGYTHEWEDLTTIAGAVREITGELSKQVAVLQQTAQNSFGTPIIGDSFGLGQKNDAPFTYLNTQRFTVTLDVLFSVYDNAKSDVFDPIKKLIDMSCPEMGHTSAFSTDIKFPYVFEVGTYTGSDEPSHLINLRDAALTQITPTWNGPYIGGYPTSASVNLTFVDIYPVYRNRDAKMAEIEVKEKAGSPKQ